MSRIIDQLHESSRKYLDCLIRIGAVHPSIRPGLRPRLTNTMYTSRLVSRLSRPWRKISARTTSTSSSPPTTPITSGGTSIAEPKPSLPSAPQAPNYPTTWTTSQRKRPVAGEGPRFEQTNMELQPQPLSAMEMINAEPIRIVHGRRAVCDGGECIF